MSLSVTPSLFSKFGPTMHAASMHGTVADLGCRQCLTEGTHFSQNGIKCLDFQSYVEAFLFSVGRVLYAVPCVYLYTNMDSAGKQTFCPFTALFILPRI